MATRPPHIDPDVLDRVPWVEPVIEPVTLEPIETSASGGAGERSLRSLLFEPRLVGLVWLVGVVFASALTPAAASEMPQPAWLDLLGEVSAWAWLGLVVAAMAGFRRTAGAGVALGGVMLAGMVGCAGVGHATAMPGVFAAQTAVIVGLTAYSGAAALRR